MRIILLLTITCFLLNSPASIAGSKKFGHEEAMKFDYIMSEAITDNGKFVYYNTKPSRGNGKLHLHDLENDDYIFFERGGRLSSDANTSVFAFLEAPDVIDKANADKEKTKNTLKIYYPIGSRIESVQDVKKYKLAKTGEWIFYRGYDKNKNKDKKSNKKYGTMLTMRHLKSGTEIPIKDVYEYKIDSAAKYIIYSVSGEDEANDGIFYRELSRSFVPEVRIEQDSNARYSSITWDDDKLDIAFLKTLPDSNGQYRYPSLYKYTIGGIPLEVVPSEMMFKDSEWQLYGDDISFSEDGSKIFFGARPAWRMPLEKDDEEDWTDSTYFDFDKILDDKKMNIWHWEDQQIVTEAQTSLDRTKRATFLGVYDVNGGDFRQLADTNMVYPNGTRYSNQYLTFRDYDKYAKQVTWMGWFYDLLLVDMHSGEVITVVEELEHKSDMSPDGTRVCYFDDGNWFLFDTQTKESKNISEGSGIVFQNQEEDRPRIPGSYGFMGWEKGSGNPIFYDKYAAYSYNLIDGGFINITKPYRQHANQRFRYFDTDGDDPWIATMQTINYNVWDYSAKTRHFYSINAADRTISHKLEGDFVYKAQSIADDSPKMLFSRENFRTFPDIYVSNKNLTDTVKVSNVHPTYLEDYNWGKPNQVKWFAETGDTLYGTYILPDDYSPRKEYPVFIYYYEKFGDRHNQWNQPTVNHRPNYQTFTSDGYIMFLPDIYFRPGDPGSSSTESMMDAMEALSKVASIDSTKVILHGHSWSGYQSAYIGTQTDYFAGIITGAPVSNMTSAYSGIRLGSGLARQFQYETGQSRIGGNLIDSLDAYIRNSPVFFADKMNTPMLIQFGDIDDAVPYSQGVELYLALRRFQKPAIMLQYEGEPHHLKKYANKLDYLIKMKEFADYYTGKLLEKPKWMDGVPYWKD